MAHGRQQVRDAVVTAVTGLATTGTNVYSGRVYPLERAKLPALVVYSLSEEVLDDAGTMSLLQMRRLTVEVQVVADATTDLDDTLDDICSEVETAIHADTTLGGLAKWIEFASVEIELEEGGQKPVGTASMRFQADYRIDAAAPETIIT